MGLIEPEKSPPFQRWARLFDVQNDWARWHLLAIRLTCAAPLGDLTLYSLRHTYATLELLNNRTDIHTLAKQMGNSAAMIERHYSKLTATMAAERLA